MQRPDPAETQIELLGRSSSINVRKVLWLAVELGLPLAHQERGSAALPLSDPAFLRLNPKGLVPVLRDGDFVLTESNTICRYLAARQGRFDLLPQDAKARARVEQWMDWQASDLNNAWRYAFMALVRRHADFRDGDAIERSSEAWNRQMQILDLHLQHTAPYVAGQTFTLADIVLGLSVHRWLATPIDKPTLPAVLHWYDRLQQRPGCVRHCANGVP